VCSSDLEFRHVIETDLRQALPQLTRLGAPLIVHAEVPGPVNRAVNNIASDTGAATEYATFLASRPRAAEDEAIELMVRLSREFKARVHIVHHSSADSLPLLRAAKQEGLPVTAETCPHYLSFVAEEIPSRATEFKCCPPIRERDNREQLWQALTDRTLDMIVSDHSPCPPEMKLPETGDFLKAWGGISSLQLRLPIVWTEAKKRGFSLADITRWLCSAPAKLVGLDQQKGHIARGQDADFVIWNAEAEFRVSKEMLHHRHKLTPYEGKSLKGVVEKTFLRGRKIYDDGEFAAGMHGQLLTPKRQVNDLK